MDIFSWLKSWKKMFAPKLWFSSKRSQFFLVSMVNFRVVYVWYVYQVYIETLSIKKMQEIWAISTADPLDFWEPLNSTSYHPTLPAPNHKVRKKFRGYFRGTCSDLSNATMEVGEVSQGWWEKSRKPATNVSCFFLFGKGRKSGRHFIFIFVWKRKR